MRVPMHVSRLYRKAKNQEHLAKLVRRRNWNNAFSRHPTLLMFSSAKFFSVWKGKVKSQFYAWVTFYNILIFKVLNAKNMYFARHGKRLKRDRSSANKDVLSISMLHSLHPVIPVFPYFAYVGIGFFANTYSLLYMDSMHMLSLEISRLQKKNIVAMLRDFGRTKTALKPTVIFDKSFKFIKCCLIQVSNVFLAKATHISPGLGLILPLPKKVQFYKQQNVIWRRAGVNAEEKRFGWQRQSTVFLWCCSECVLWSWKCETHSDLYILFISDLIFVKKMWLQSMDQNTIDKLMDIINWE